MRGKITTPVEVLVTGVSRLSVCVPIIKPPMTSTGSSVVSPPAYSMHSRNVVPMRHFHRRGRFHRAGDGEHFVRERLAVVRGGDVHERLDVVDDDADRDGNAAGRNQFARDVIDQIVFVAGRIIIAEQLDADVRAFARGLHGFDGVFLLGL